MKWVKLGSKTKHFLAVLLMIAISFFATLAIGRLDFMGGLENQLINLRFSWKDHLKPDEEKEQYTVIGDRVKSDIMIIGIDETSMSNDFLGPFPWSRSVYADFLKYFRHDNNKYAPHYIFFDIFFDYYRTSKADKTFIQKLAAYLHGAEVWKKKNDKTAFVQEVLETYQKIPGADQVFFEELKRHDNIFFDYFSQLGTEERLKVSELGPRLELMKKNSAFPERTVSSFLKRDIFPLARPYLHQLAVNSLKKEKASPIPENLKNILKPSGIKKIFEFYQEDAVPLFIKTLKQRNVNNPEKEVKAAIKSAPQNVAVYLRTFLEKEMAKNANTYLKSSQISKLEHYLSFSNGVKNPQVYLEARKRKLKVTIAGKEQMKEVPVLVQDIKPPVTEVIKHSKGVGTAWVEADKDEIMRQMPLVFLYDDERTVKNPKTGEESYLIDEPIFLPTIDMIFILGYFNATVDDVEIIFGKHVKIKNAKIPIKKLDKNKGGYDIIGYKTEDVTIPINNEGKMYINYQGASHSFEYKPFAYINFDKENENNPIYRNRALLVGVYSSAGLGETKDYHPTPYGSMYGIEIHANALYTIINRDFIKNVPSIIQLLFMLGLIIAIAILFDRVNIINGLVIALLALLVVFSSLAFLFSGSVFTLDLINAPLYLMNMTNPLAAIIISLILNISYKVLTEEKDKKFLKSTFSQYISPELIDIMYEAKTMPQLGGSSDELSAYFTDIQGFSTFSEKLTATQLVELLNEYLSAMTDILVAAEGTLDKYEGDAIIAFFGAPMKFEDHAVRACRVAIQMQEKLEELKVKWSQEKGDPSRNTKNVPEEDWTTGAKWPNIVNKMRMRIGINTGEIVTGNMGSKMRMNYTMMGDTVNLAARLESGAKQYGIFSMISEYTYNYEYTDESGVKKKVSDFFEARFLDKITVVGKSLPVSVYELIALKGMLSDTEKKLLKLFNEGMALYLETKWDEAKEKFDEAIQFERFPDHKINPSLLFSMRCEDYKKYPPVAPGENWDGVYRLSSK